MMDHSRILEMILRRWLPQVVMLSLGLVMLPGLFGCKKPNLSADDPVIASQLQGGIRDREFILLMVPHENWQETLEVYEFVVCKLKDKSRFHPASHYIETSTLPHSPRSHMAAFKVMSPTEQLLQALIAEGNPYPINYIDGLISEDQVVVPSTCVPAFRGIRGAPMALVSQRVDEQKINAAMLSLSNAKFRAERDNGNHFLGAFGIGAAFSSFGKDELEAIRRLIPQRYHQIPLPFGGLRKLPYVGGLFRFNWGNPGMLNLGLGMFAVGQNKPFETFISTGMDFENYKLLSTLPGQKRTLVDNVGEGAALAGTAVGGYATGRLLISRVASFVAKHATHVSGQYGTIAAGLLTPLMTTVIINASKNHGQDALDNFQEIVTTMAPPTSMTGDLSVVLSTEVRSYLPKVIHLLGRTFFHARWASPFDLYSSCIPDDTAEGYTCTPLFSSEELGTDSSAEPDKLVNAAKPGDDQMRTMSGELSEPPAEPAPGPADAGASSSSPAPDGATATAAPPPPPPILPMPSTSCLASNEVSSFASDRGLLKWQAYLNCRFYGGGLSCSQKYACQLTFTSEAECRQRAKELNVARRQKGSGEFSQGQIERNCQIGRWQ